MLKHIDTGVVCPESLWISAVVLNEAEHYNFLINLMYMIRDQGGMHGKSHMEF